MIVIPKHPIIKSKGFCPNPVAKYGIPYFADSSIRNNNVVGTPLWTDWWTEQIYYCINGYTTAGIFIPGRYYYYLNFVYISTLGRGDHHPDYVDLDLEFFDTIENAKIDGKHIIIPKARRKGVSEKFKSIIGHGSRFVNRYACGIGAGNISYIEDFIRKFDITESKGAPELKLHRLENNIKDITFGWKEKDSTGWKENGSYNKIYMRTSATNPNLFKGTMLNDLLFEESGENDLLMPTINASESCTKVGDDIVGTMYVYGTGNKSNEGSKMMEHIWNNSESLNFVRMFIPRSRLYFPCVSGSISAKTGEINEDIPNLLCFTPEERIGMEDTVRAEELLQIKEDELRKKDDKTDLIDFLQNFPKNIKDVFRKSNSNNFNSDLLNEKLFEIENNRAIENGYRFKYYKLEWVRNDKHEIVMPFQVEARMLSDEELEDPKVKSEAVIILDDGHPIKGFVNLEVAGVDSYDLDQSRTSKSLGAMVVLRQKHNIPNKRQMLPVAVIRCRPARKEIFYDLCLRLSVYYGLYGNVLIDYAKGQIIHYFKSNGGEGYLANRPIKFESEYSEQMHEYGVSINNYSKPKMIGMLQSFYLQHSKDIEIPLLLNEALDYDEGAKDSDCDATDALGIALMKLTDLGVEPVNMNDSSVNKAYSLGSWQQDSNGDFQYRDENVEDYSDISDPFMKFVMTGKFN